MPANIEIKAVLHDAAAAHAVAERLSGGPGRLIRQEDHFFAISEGRLKLRVFDSSSAELILYHRADSATVRRSDYRIARTSDPDALLEILGRTLGVRAVVKKVRFLYLVGQTRIHIDQVEGLGDYLELEVVLQSGQSDDDGGRIAAALLDQFGIRERDHVAVAYVDLLS